MYGPEAQCNKYFSEHKEKIYLHEISLGIEKHNLLRVGRCEAKQLYSDFLCTFDLCIREKSTFHKFLSVLDIRVKFIP